jgi:DNA-binding LacI/PurR family transcriptional regulator
METFPRTGVTGFADAMPRPTIKDVAQKAGVGVGTVSRVLNNSPKVTPETRKLVLDVIAELGFKPNTVARQLSRKTRVQNIGVITQPFISYRAFAERLRGVQLALSEAETEYELVLYTVGSLAHYDERLTTIVQTGVVDGLIIIDLNLYEEQQTRLQKAKLPVVGINHLKNQAWPCIGTDNVEGGYLAGRYLLDCGHTRIAYVGDELVDTFEFISSAERFDGFRQALADCDISLPEAYVQLGSHDYEVARQSALNLFQLSEPPSAIFAMSDMQAFGCLAAAREMGLRVPEDVSIIGYDDLEFSQHIGLTSVRQHLELSGRIAIDYLLCLLQGNEIPPPQLPPLEVIERQTTRKLKEVG